MSSLIIVIIFIVGLIVFPTTAIIYKDLERTAIIIDDSSEAPGLHELQRQEDDISLQEKSCFKDGINGKCMTVKDCYPFLRYVDKPDLVNMGLLEFVENSTRVCDPVKPDHICCGDRAVSYVRIRKNEPSSSVTQKTSVTLPTETNQATNCQCGQAGIRGDRPLSRPAFRYEFPFAVTILIDGVHICGGSLISSRWILTAAHCVNGVQDTRVLTINLGELDLASSIDHVSSGVDKIVYHSDFTMRNLTNNIALIRLANSVPFSDAIQPICLQAEKSETLPSHSGYLIGWGRSEAGKPITTTLQMIKIMSIIPKNECRKKFKAIGIEPPELSEEMVCIGARKKLPDVECMGDSGSPFSFYQNETATLVAFASWSIGCARLPGLYTHVSPYIDWIHKNMY